MVKNEQDIIRNSVAHMLDQGVDYVLIVDNMSTDETHNILAELEVTGRVFVGIDSVQGYYQDHKMTRLASYVRKRGAQWIVPFDADEFWFGKNKTLANVVRESRSTVLFAKIYNAFPVRESQELSNLNDDYLIDTTAAGDRKVAVRSHPLLWITMGNHAAFRPGRTDEALRVLHMPWRSREQFIKKTRQGATAFRQATSCIPVANSWTTHDLYSDKQLADVWKSIVARDRIGRLAWGPVGPFVRSDRFNRWRDWDPNASVEQRQ